jgi:hypothetical protein
VDDHPLIQLEHKLARAEQEARKWKTALQDVERTTSQPVGERLDAIYRIVYEALNG